MAWAGAYRGGRPPTAYYSLLLYSAAAFHGAYSNNVPIKRFYGLS